jgi:hypothetical protein
MCCDERSAEAGVEMSKTHARTSCESQQPLSSVLAFVLDVVLLMPPAGCNLVTINFIQLAQHAWSETVRCPCSLLIKSTRRFPFRQRRGRETSNTRRCGHLRVRLQRVVPWSHDHRTQSHQTSSASLSSRVAYNLLRSAQPALCAPTSRGVERNKERAPKTRASNVVVVAVRQCLLDGTLQSRGQR